MPLLIAAINISKLPRFTVWSP